MPRKAGRRKPRVAEQVLEPSEETLLDLLDHVLNKGVMATGDVTLGVAGIDLIYLRLSALLCAADRVMPGAQTGKKRLVKRRQSMFGPSW